jgi:hypothetical protein
MRYKAIKEKRDQPSSIRHTEMIQYWLLIYSETIVNMRRQS